MPQTCHTTGIQLLLTNPIQGMSQERYLLSVRFSFWPLSLHFKRLSIRQNALLVYRSGAMTIATFRQNTVDQLFQCQLILTIATKCSFGFEPMDQPSTSDLLFSISWLEVVGNLCKATRFQLHLRCHILSCSLQANDIRMAMHD